MNKSNKAFANDLSAYRRIKSALQVLARGKGKHYSSWDMVDMYLKDLKPRDIPCDLQPALETWKRFRDHRRSSLKKPTIEEATNAIVELFEGISAARGAYGIDSRYEKEK